jgi:hypothetical protein
LRDGDVVALVGAKLVCVGDRVVSVGDLEGAAVGGLSVGDFDGLCVVDVGLVVGDRDSPGKVGPTEGDEVLVVGL